MNSYQIHNDKLGQLACIWLTQSMAIPPDPANADFEKFKRQINADEAELLDNDGNLMTPEEAKNFVATLP